VRKLQDRSDLRHGALRGIASELRLAAGAAADLAAECRARGYYHDKAGPLAQTLQALDARLDAALGSA
jgi:hypothetical protein